MRLAHLTLTDFRNFASLQTEIPPGPTVSVGANAQGKTSLEVMVALADRD